MAVYAWLLGVAQDGGLPQPGCHCSNCNAARSHPERRQQVVSLGIVDESFGQSWLIDATPDFPAQFDALSTRAPLAGILLTHAHMGHYPGLLYLGPEAMNARAMPVYATERMAAFLQRNAPWSGLVQDGHIELIEVRPGVEIALSPAVAVMPVAVPHRDEYTDTVAWVVRGPDRSLFYCPDIDNWAMFQPQLRSWLAPIAIALLDGTFFAAEELPHRDITQIPHPLVTDTAALLADASTEIVFIHLNHTNPLWGLGPERAWLEARNLGVGAVGQRWQLG